MGNSLSVHPRYFYKVVEIAKKKGVIITLEGNQQYFELFLQAFDRIEPCDKNNSIMKATIYALCAAQLNLTYYIDFKGRTTIVSKFDKGIIVQFGIDEILNQDIYAYLIVAQNSVKVACVRHPMAVVIGHENGHVFRLANHYKMLIKKRFRNAKNPSSLRPKEKEELLQEAYRTLGEEDYERKLKPFINKIVDRLHNLIGYNNENFATNMDDLLLDLRNDVPILLWNQLNKDIEVRKYLSPFKKECIDAIESLETFSIFGVDKNSMKDAQSHLKSP